MLRRARGGIWSLADAGQASLATFIAGILALRVLEDGELALYALVFAAGVALMILPQFAVFTIQRLHVNRHQEIYRPRYRADARQVLPLAVATALGVAAAGLPMRGQLDLDVFLVLCGSAAAWVVVSPFQDHVRAALHATSHHGRAAVVSSVNLATVAAGIALTALLPTEGAAAHLVRVALPFSLLVLGNLASAAVGLVLHRPVPRVPERAVHGWRESSWASTPALLAHGANYLRTVLMGALAGPAALVALEAARVASQPVLVLGTGLAAFFVPTAVRLLGAGRVREAYRHVARQNAWVLAGGFAFSGALVWITPVVATIADRVIQVPLAVARGAAATLGAAAAPHTSLNLASRRYSRAVVVTAAGEGLGIVAVVALAGSLGVYAMPVGAGLAGIARIGGEWVARRRAHDIEGQG